MRDEMGRPLPVEIGSRQAKYDRAPELLERGEWICLNIDPSCAWPVWPQFLIFDSQCIWIIPLTLEEYPGVAIQRSSEMNQHDAESLLYRFLSVLAWQHDCGIAVVHRTGGSLPFMMGLNKKYGFSIRKLFDLTEIAYPTDERTRIALGLMREARSLNHSGYAFLSFWRVLELAFPSTKDRAAWIAAKLPNLASHDVKDALISIERKNIQDIGMHLFRSGRCAIAHATGEPIVNPDDPRDARRLLRELPLVRELAVRAIEEKFGVLTSFTEYDLHFYELRGWKNVLGADLVARLLRNEGGHPDETIELPDIHVRLRESPIYETMEKLIAVNLSLEDSGIKLFYRSSDLLFEIRFSIDLKNERLIFDITESLFLEDDGSVAAACHLKNIECFIRDYFLNGELQIWNAQTSALLSRKDAFIPVNCHIDLDAANARIASRQAEIDRRKSVSDKFAGKNNIKS